MNAGEFARKIVKITPTHWSLVLNNKRNLSYTKAALVAQLLNTKESVWIDPKVDKAARKEAWKKFQEGEA